MGKGVGERLFGMRIAKPDSVLWRMCVYLVAFLSDSTGQQWPGSRRWCLSVLFPCAADVVLQLLSRQILCCHHQQGQPGSAEAIPNQHKEVRLMWETPLKFDLFIYY